MVTWTENKNLDIFEVNYIGLVTDEDVFAYIKGLANIVNNTKEIKILTDATKAIYNINAIDDITIEQLKSKIKTYLPDFISVKNAIIHSKPRETAMSLITEELVNKENYLQKVFHTKREALIWLNDE